MLRRPFCSTTELAVGTQRSSRVSTQRRQVLLRVIAMLLEMMEDKKDQRKARGSSAPDIEVRPRKRRAPAPRLKERVSLQRLRHQARNGTGPTLTTGRE